MMRPIPYVQKEDVTRWEAVLNAVVAKVDAAVAAGAIQNGRQLVLQFRNCVNSAVIGFVRGDDAAFLKSAKSALDRFRSLLRPPLMTTIDPEHIYGAMEDAFYLGLILRDEDALRDLCINGIQHVLAHSDERAEFLKRAIELLSGVRLHATQTKATSSTTNSAGIQALNAVAENDRARFRSALQQALSEFDVRASGEARGTPEAAIFLQGAALVRLYERVNSSEIDRQGLDERLLTSMP